MDSMMFMPHGGCYLWIDSLILLHSVSDSVTALAYFSIPCTLIYFVKKRPEVEFHWIFVCFAMFITSCGVVHLIEVWNIWRADYWVSGAVKSITAAVSAVTAVLLIRLIPKALALPLPEDLRRINRVLREEVSSHQRTSEKLKASEAFTRNWLNQTTDGVWDWELETGAQYLSPRLKESLGYRDDEIPNTHEAWRALIHSDDRGRVLQEMDSRVIEGAGCDIQFRVSRKDGSYRWVICRGVSILNSEGRTVRMVGTHTDITELKDAKESIERSEEQARNLHRSLEQQFQIRTEELRQSEKRLQGSLRELSDFKTALDAHAIVAITDKRGKITYVNEKFCAISKFQRDELLGQDHRIVNSGLHSREFFRTLWSTIGSGKVWRGEIRNRAKDGSLYWVDTTIVPFLDNEGLPYQYVAIRADVTDRKLAEQEVRELNANLEKRVATRTEQLTQLNKELESFSYSVSHDLRAPLRHISGFTKLLSDHVGANLDSVGERYLKTIGDSAVRMGTLIDELLVFSRMGRAEVCRSLVDQKALIDEAIDQWKHELEGRNVSWKIDPIPAISSDPSLMRQVWINLLGNAIKYTRNREEARIEVGYRHDEKAGHVITVRDNGAGFDMKYYDKLFGVFQRLHSPTEFEGTGIGLANAQRIVSRHGGRIWGEGKVDDGATFHFTIPDENEVAESEAFSK